MSASESAKIIPFPDRSAAKPPAPSPTPGRAGPSAAEARLTRALAGLNDAVNAQREAMAAWRSALGDLRTVTGRLGTSLRTYHDSLGKLDTRVSSLRSEAVKLEAWADNVLAKKG